MKITKSNNKGDTIFSPLSGEVIELSEVPDSAFRSELLGKGIAIVPENGEVIAPFDGKIVALFPTNHAIGIKNDFGLEVLIHIGIDTVNMAGDGFEAHVKMGDMVKQGDKLIDFNVQKIKSFGLLDMTMVVVTNLNDFDVIVEKIKRVKVGEKIIYAKKRE